MTIGWNLELQVDNKTCLHPNHQPHLHPNLEFVHHVQNLNNHHHHHQYISSKKKKKRNKKKQEEKKHTMQK